MSKRMLVMAGGTGGHVFPGIAVADALKEQGWNVSWLGTPDKMEARIVPSAGYPIHFINISGVRGNGIKRLLLAPLMIVKAIWQARKVLRQVQPDVVLGMGGFASGPGGIAAWLQGIPLVVHEQNAVPGMTNRLLSKVAKKVLQGFDGSFPGVNANKTQWVGNPIRAAFAAIDSQSVGTERDAINLLVLGGSLGAKALNDTVPQALALLQQGGLRVRHQAGRDKEQAVMTAYETCANADLEWQVSAFIDDMTEAYEWSDIIICRAGALTVAEVAASGRCAIFVPLPHAVDDHQTKNAQSLVAQEAALLLPQSQLTPQRLQGVLEDLMSQPETIASMASRAKKMAKLDATQQVADVCATLAEDGK